MIITDATVRLCKLLNHPLPTDWGLEEEQLLDAAADEIERLRAALEKMGGEPSCG